jgi:hypothetical protein
VCWFADASRRFDYLNPVWISPEELARRRREFAEQQAIVQG